MISTDEVYGESSLPCNESSPMAPSNPYAASKAGADLIAQSYYKSFNVPIIIVRPNNQFMVKEKRPGSFYMLMTLILH